MDDLSSLISTDDIMVEIEIRLGRTRRTVAELSRLRHDDVLAMDHDIADGVEICVGDKVIARGELCDDGTGEGRLAVRILGTQSA